MIKRAPADAAFSDAIRWSYDWRCQYFAIEERKVVQCEMAWPECKGRDAHCSHFKSRSYSSLRYYPDNAVLLCANHHDYVGKNPDAHTAFFKRHLGDIRFEEMIERQKGLYRYRKDDKKAIAKHYRSEVERIKELRNQGRTGYIALVSYD